MRQTAEGNHVCKGLVKMDASRCTYVAHWAHGSKEAAEVCLTSLACL